MASTSTNKQPLLVDRPLFASVDLSERIVSETSNGIDIGGSNSAIILVDCTKNDGAVIDDIYSYSRDATEVDDPDGNKVIGYEVFLYMSVASDFLRNNEAYFVGSFTSADAAAGTKQWEGFPRTLRPVPKVGSTDDENVIGTYFRCLFIPRGMALWAAAKKRNAADDGNRAPLLLVQGGFF